MCVREWGHTKWAAGGGGGGFLGIAPWRRLTDCTLLQVERRRMVGKLQGVNCPSEPGPHRGRCLLPPADP